MATSFTREEKIMFDDMVEGFDDALVIAKAAELYEPASPEEMVHLGDKFWIPAPMIGSSYDGFDQTSNFDGLTELVVPVSVGFHKSSPKTLSAKNLRNKTALRNYGNAAKLKLSSDINYALFQRVALEGSITIKRTVAATGYDDVALADAAMTEKGIPGGERFMFLSPRDYNAMAGNIAKPQTSSNSKVNQAFEKAYLGDVAGFDTYKNDQTIRLTAATGGAILVNGANQYLEPVASTTAATGEIENKDNRYSDLVVDGGTYANIKAGDRFTIAGVNSVHMITKQDTGQLQTFSVISKPAANTIRIAPAIISNGGSTIAGKEYQNVTATPADDAALTWLNTTTAALNPFFKKGSLLLVPGSFTVDPEDGWQVMRATTDLGIGITYTRQGDINTLNVKARWDVDFGTSLPNPEMAGVTFFGQA